MPLLREGRWAQLALRHCFSADQGAVSCSNHSLVEVECSLERGSSKGLSAELCAHPRRLVFALVIVTGSYMCILYCLGLVRNLRISRTTLRVRRWTMSEMNRDGFAGGQIIYMASRLSDSLVS
jgi:hypothetical protein